MPIHDIRCPSCGWGKADTFVRVEEMPSCDECGVPTKVDWGHGIAPSVRGHGYGSFTAVDMGVLGKAETKEDYDRAVATIQQRFPGQRVELTSETKAQKQARLDGVRQRAYESRKKAGVDDRIRAEMKEEKTRKKAEAPPAPPAAKPAAAGAA
jgi:hypothetical protein